MNQPFKVLLVEDDPTLRDLVCLALSREFGCQIVTAEDGPQALKRLQECRPEVVIIEIQIPQINGLEVLRRWRKRDGMNGAAVFVTSALGYQEIVQQAAAAGVRDFLVKPYDVETLVQRLAQALEAKGGCPSSA